MDPLTERRFLPNYYLEALNIHFGVFLGAELQKVIEQVFTRCQIKVICQLSRLHSYR